MASRLDRFVAFLGTRRGVVLVLVSTVLLLLPAMETGLVLDDHMHRGLMSDAIVEAEWIQWEPWDLYSFLPDDPAFREAGREAGGLPWYADPEIHATFMRPISSLLLYLDYVIAPESPRVAHAHSILWFLATVLAVWLVMRRLFESPGIAGLATALFAWDDAHGGVVAWVANRNALLAMFFALLALYFHMRWRRDGPLRHVFLSCLFLVLGLLSAEVALSITAYLFAFAVFLDTGPWRARLFSLAPAALVCAVWRFAYNLLGFGASGSGLYIDPVGDPLRYAAAAAERLPVLVLAQLTPIGSEFFPFAERPVAIAWVAFALVALGLLAWGSWGLIRRDPLSRFFLVGMLVSALPMCATFPNDRLLVPLGVGAFGFVARAVELYLERDGPVRPGAALVWVLLAFHLVLAPVMLPLKAYSLRSMGRLFEGSAHSLDFIEDIEDRTVVFVNGPDYFTTAWTPIIRRNLGKEAPKTIRLLGTSLDPVTVTRTGERTLRLRPERGYLLSVLDLVMRSPVSRPFRVGDTVAVSDLHITVTEVMSDGRPGEIECVFLEALHSPKYVWVAWTADGFREVVLPERGESIVLPGTTQLELLLNPPASP